MRRQGRSKHDESRESGLSGLLTSKSCPFNHWLAMKDTRSAILEALRKQDAWITGEKLGERLHISRAAVSKHVQALRQTGYQIETLSKRGYHFLSAPDKLLPVEVLPLSTCKTFGKSLYEHYDTIDSTNIRARALAEAGCPNGALVVAEGQSEGRGRKGRLWTSPAGDGIYATLILHPKLPLEDTPLLTLLTAVATAQSIIEVADIQPAIKWPNDILVNGHKVAGILTEVSSDVDRVEFALIGIGLNVNTSAEELPDRPIFPASSLAIEAGSHLSRARLLAAWLDRMESAYSRFIAGDRESLLNSWKQLAGIMGKRVTIKRIHDSVSGTVKDIDSDGALILISDKGEQTRILSGDVKFDT